MNCPTCGKDIIRVPEFMFDDPWTSEHVDVFHCPKCDTFYGILNGELRLLRRSPGTNWYAMCVARQMTGKKFVSKKEANEAFALATKKCIKEKGQ